MTLIDKLEQFAPWAGGETEAIMNAAAAELRRLAAVESELERIKALEPVAWALRFNGDSRLCLSCVFDTEKEANEYAEQTNHIEEVVPLYALGSKTNE